MTTWGSAAFFWRTETTTKHTPGPWVASNDLCHVFGRSGWSVGPHGVTTAVCGDTPPAEEQEANARLIAAAPELLEALECVTGLIAWARDHGASYTEPIEHMARNAIAKATRETQ